MLYRVLLLSPIFAILFLISCDEDPEPDTVKPELTAQVLYNGSPLDPAQPVRGILHLSITSLDNVAITSLMVSVDNAVIQEVQTETIEFDFDTRTIPDGNHTLKIVATDNTGNTAETTIPFITKNAYITYTMPADNFETGGKYWMILSDDEGTIHDFKSMQPGAKTFVSYPLDYAEGDDQYFTVFTRYGGDVYARTYKNLPEGDYTSVILNAAPWPNVGVHRVNVPDGYGSFLNVTSSSMHYTTLFSQTFVDLQLLQDPADLYILSTQNAQPTYFYDPTITGGSSTTVDDDFINNMLPLAKHTMTGIAGTNVTALVQANIPGHPYPSFNCYTKISGESTIDLYYPEELEGTLDIFSSAYFGKEENGFHVTCSEFKPDGLLNSINELGSALQTVTSKNYPDIDIDFTGSADFIKLIMGTPDSFSFTWQVRLPFSNNVEFSLPEFSSTHLTELGLESMPVVRTDYILLVKDELPRVNEHLTYSLINPGYDLIEADTRTKNYDLNQ